MSTALRDQIFGLIGPFNKKGVELTDATTFAGDLEWDSLTVMDFVAAIEDEFDIIISMNHAGGDRNRRPAGRRGGEAAPPDHHPARC